MFKIIRIALTTLVTLGAVSPAVSHEFWIEPLRYQLQTGETIEARFRNGEEFEGTELGFFDRRSAQLQIAFSGRRVDLTPRNGDRPAISAQPLGTGLHVLVHETKTSTIRYKEWAKFAKFAKHKDFPDIKARHDARGLPDADFTEQYSRHAKALVAIGGHEGADTRFGLETEIVALSNPYDPNFNQKLGIQVFDQSATRPDAQIEVFEKAPDVTVTVTLTRTDSQGLAMIATKPGHDYLLDAVVLRPAPDDAEHVWETYWAALTFSVPK